MDDFVFLTNRPARSNAHVKGHIAVHFYSKTAPSVSIKADGSNISYSNTSTPGNGIYVVHVPSSVYQNRKRIDITVNGNTKRIDIVKKACKTYTIAWLTPLGGIDHYTFYVDPETEVTSEKEKILIDDGYKTVASDAENGLTVKSDYERLEIKNWIAEIISSPKTFLVQNGQIMLIDILSDNTYMMTKDLYQVEISFRKKPVVLQQV